MNINAAQTFKICEHALILSFYRGVGILASGRGGVEDHTESAIALNM